MNRHLSMPAIALASVLAFTACAETSNNESAGAYLDDSAITGKVKSAILQDPALKVLQIDVTTYKNVVQLSGFVDTPEMVTQAGVVAKSVNGVVSVKNDLIVK
ncbi:BON domain-containing protein [Oceanibacterium hippocampi]|uniref:Osmotically-inducible protein Y n=1 Tax=Oceanibacterium hippocampi TaxID=745714 RepID=A0A1Y5TSG2_9PROT|nr:BON domain-containing protein [Oceanibacterium hippocampi]SLN66933.1 Osmotically-inducible protein Y precursor [Oceanibacterium hippocampi]